MSIVPPAKPKMSREEAVALAKAKAGYRGGVIVLGIRGYYRDSMGVVGKNDRAIYDDALIVLTDNAFATFNGNTDPRIYSKGKANLKTGAWRYKKGKHKILSPLGYPAFVQARPVTVIRDQVGPDTGWFGINIHRGGVNNTSSAGCQTLPPNQWDAFKNLVYTELDRANQKEFWYVLIDGPVK